MQLCKEEAYPRFFERVLTPLLSPQKVIGGTL